MAIGDNEVRITKVWTIEALNEFSADHDATPNWKENGPLAPNLALRFHAEAGKNVGGQGAGGTYSVTLHAVCLSTPFWSNLPPMQPLQPAEAFNSWEYQASEEMYTKDWRIVLPVPPAFFMGGPQTWQYHVSLVRTAGTSFASTRTSEAFKLF